MKKYDVVVNNNLFRIEYEPTQSSATINDVIQYINKQKGFPARAKLYITVDDHIKDIKFDLNSAKSNIIYINFSDIIDTFTISHINKEENYKIVLENVDTCQQLIEIEKKIANKINCQEYPIKILKKNQFVDRNLFLCQIFFYQQEIHYFVLAKFFIRHKDKLQLFQIDAYSHFDKIKQKVRQQFRIDEEIELYFKDQLLEEQKTYFSYKIQQNAELVLKIKNMQKISIWYLDKIYDFNVSVNQTIKDLINYYKQFDTIHQNQVLQVEYNNQYLDDTIKIGSLDLSNNNQFTITNKIPEKSLVIKFVNKEQVQFYCQLLVSNLDFFSILYEKQPFKGKIVEFYVNDNKLKITDKLMFNDIKFKDNLYLIDYQIIQTYQIINVTFKDEEGKTFIVQVNSEDIINNEINKNVNYDNTRVKAYKNGQLIDLNGTYTSEEIQDGDIIYYCLAELYIQVMIWQKNQHYIKEMSVNYLHRIIDLKEKIINQFKITDDCKILLDGNILDDNEYIKNQKKNAVFRLSKRFHFKIELLLDNNIEQSEDKFYETDKVSQIKYQFRELFEDEVCIQVDNKEDLNDDDEVSEYINKVLRISKKNIIVKYKFEGTQTTYDGKYQKNITLGEMLKIIANRKSRCYIANNLMDQNIKLINLNLDPNTVITIECTRRAQFIELNNNLNRVDIDFYPEDIIDQAIKIHIKGNCTIQKGNHELNLQNSFKTENIENADELFYTLIITIKFMKFDTKELMFSQICNLNMKISQILIQNNFNKIKVYYLEQEINQDRTLAEIGVADQSEIYLQETEKTLKLHYEDQIQLLSINMNITIELFKQQQNLNQENYQLYLFNDQIQALSNEIILKSLLNQNNEVELIYKMDNRYIKIYLIDIDENKFIEYIQLNQQIKTFIQEFKNKHNLNEIEIFYDGGTVNQDQYFSDLQITQDAQFEFIL